MAGISFKTVKQTTPVMSYTSVTGSYNTWYGFYSTSQRRSAAYYQYTNNWYVDVNVYWEAEVA